VLVPLLLVSSLPVGAATTYYVSPGGDDLWAGTQAYPWATIGHAASMVTAGDTVLIKQGTYAERVAPTLSGSPGNVITFAAYPGHSVTIDGTGVSLPPGWGGLFEISGLSDITVQGIALVNAGTDDNHAGFLVEGSSNITIQGCTTTDTRSSGIGVWSSSNITISGNEVVLACNDGEQECITIADTDGFVVANNHVHHGGPGSIGGEGIDTKDGSRNGIVLANRVHHINRLGIYADAWDEHTFNIEVLGNTVYSCHGSGLAVAAENGGLLESVKLYNNLSYDNYHSGISVGGWGEPGAAHPMATILIVNNTLVGNGTSGWGGGVFLENSEATGVVIRNNVCSNNQSFQIADEIGLTDLVVSHNLLDTFQDYPGELYGTAYQLGDPLFVAASSKDFHLTAGSPAVDNGTSLDAPSTDLDGCHRPLGAAVDIGAFEFGYTIFVDGFESSGTSAWSSAMTDKICRVLHPSYRHPTGRSSTTWAAVPPPALER